MDDGAEALEHSVREEGDGPGQETQAGRGFLGDQLILKLKYVNCVIDMMFFNIIYKSQYKALSRAGNPGR